MAQNATTAWFTSQTPMRATPTGIFSGGLNLIQGNSNFAVTAVSALYSYEDGITFGLNVSSGLVAASAVLPYAVTTTGVITLSAEL